MSRTAVFAFLILSLVAASCFGGALLLVLNEAVLGRIGPRALALGLAGGALAAGLAWLWFRAALQLTREPGAGRGAAVRPGAWAAALVGAGVAATSLLHPRIWPVGAVLVVLCLLAALPHMGAPPPLDRDAGDR